MKKPLMIANAVAPFGVVRPVCLALLTLCVALGSCGKKEEKGQEQKEAPASVPERKETPAQSAPPPAPAVKEKSDAAPATPAPTPAPAEPKPVASASKPKSGSSAEWAHWERVAENARSIGLTVRSSDNPRWIEVVVGPVVSLSEARVVAKNVQRELGLNDSVVRVFNEAGAPLVEVTPNGIQ